MGKAIGKQQTSIYLPEDLNHELRCVAAEMDTHITTIIEEILFRHLQEWITDKRRERFLRAQVTPTKG